MFCIRRVWNKNVPSLPVLFFLPVKFYVLFFWLIAFLAAPQIVYHNIARCRSVVHNVADHRVAKEYGKISGFVSVLSLPVDGITKNAIGSGTNPISGRANWSLRCRLNGKIQMFYVVVHDCFFVGLQEYNTAHAINMIGLLYFFIDNFL